MNYLKVYCNLIRKAENRTSPEGYTEKHHIFPKSIYGNNNRLVILTAREHYIAHALLEKVYMKRYGLKDRRTIKMIYAHCMMKASGRYISSYLYEGARIRQSELMKGNTYMLGRVHSEEHKQKISETHKGNTYWLGKTHSDESKQKISEAHKDRTFSEEHKANISSAKKGHPSWNKGISHTNESKANISAGRKGKGKEPKSEDHKRKIGESQKGKIISEEHKQKIREAQKGNQNCLGRVLSEESKQKMSAAKKGKPLSEEHKQKIREAHKKRKSKEN
jgi:hypothetical protein